MRGPDQPPKPTRDPDRSRPHDPDLWSRPLCFMLVGHFLFQSSEKYYTLYYKVLLQYYFVLQSISLYYQVRCWVISWILEKFWPSRSRPRSRPFQTRSRPVPWNPRAVSIHSHVAQEEKTGLCIQCRMIWFSLSRIWNDYHDSRHSVPDMRKKTFYESGRSRRPDHRGTIQTRLSTHAHMTIITMRPLPDALECPHPAWNKGLGYCIQNTDEYSHMFLAQHVFSSVFFKALLSMSCRCEVSFISSWCLQSWAQRWKYCTETQPFCTPKAALADLKKLATSWTSCASPTAHVLETVCGCLESITKCKFKSC